MQKEAYDALKFPINSTTTMLSIKAGELCGYNPDITLQVLGEMIMVSVQGFPQQVREACIKAAQNEIDESERGWGVMRVNERSV